MEPAKRQLFRELREAAIAARERGDFTIIGTSTQRSTYRHPRTLARAAERKLELEQVANTNTKRGAAAKALVNEISTMPYYVRLYLLQQSHTSGASKMFCLKHGLRRVEFMNALREHRLNSPFTSK